MSRNPGATAPGHKAQNPERTGQEHGDGPLALPRIALPFDPISLGEFR